VKRMNLDLPELRWKLIKKLSASFFDKTFNATFTGEALNNEFDSLKASKILSALEIQAFIFEHIIRPDPDDQDQLQFFNGISVEIERRLAGRIQVSSYQDLIQLTQRIEWQSSTPNQLLSLEYFIMSNGLYLVALDIRRKAVDKILKDPKSSCPDIVLRRFSAAMEASQLENAHSVLNELQSTGPISWLRNCALKDRLSLYHSILAKDTQQRNRLFDRYYGKNDRDFAAFVKGKSIAIVGPAPSETYDKQEIDQFDLVMRLNYQGRENMPDPDIYGSRIDISYFNVNNARKMLENNNGKLAKDLQYGIFKSEKHARTASFLCPSRMAKTPEEYWLQGWPNMIQIALFDLLAFEPARIKVFKINFYLSETLHYKGYQTRHVNIDDPKFLFKGHACHHIVRQLDFIRQMVKYQLIEVDKTCELIIGMTDDDYLKAMEDLYVNRYYETIL